MQGRRHAAARWISWARDARGSGPLLWVHAASVGELRTVEPVLRRLRGALPEIRVVVTHTSPSLSHAAVSEDVERCDFLPLDEPGHLAPTLDALRPVAIVFSRADVWPELVHRATARDVPTMVVGGTVRPTSSRLRRPARWLLQEMHRALTWVGAVTNDDGERWTRLGVPADRVRVTGDPRHDAILERVPTIEPARAVTAWAGAAPVLVAGSVEPSDVSVLASALHRLVAEAPSLHAVIVPHDPIASRVRALREALDRRDISTGVWPGSPHPLPDVGVVIADVRGLLADLYLAASVAYVGGGFRPGTLHAVAEAAAFAVPVIVGPRWRGAADVPALLAAGGAAALPARHAADVLAQRVGALVRDRGERDRCGLAGRSVVASGAARRSADAILRVLTRRG